MFNLNKEKQLISKSEILKYFNELEIFQHYIDDEVMLGKLILSPLRREKNPSFGFFIGEGNEICFNDFKLGKGDFIQFLRLRDGLTYFEALSKVANDFNIQDDYICKIYQPFSENYKWINNHNNSIWQGWTQLPESGDNLIITKSLKDVMALYEVAKLPAIAMQSENMLPKRHVFEQLNTRFKAIELLYDNDYDKDPNWGRIFADKFAKEFGLVDSFIPDKYESKDFSDLVKNFGKEKADHILLYETLLPF